MAHRSRWLGTLSVCLHRILEVRRPSSEMLSSSICHSDLVCSRPCTSLISSRHPSMKKEYFTLLLFRLSLIPQQTYLLHATGVDLWPTSTSFPVNPPPYYVLQVTSLFHRINFWFISLDYALGCINPDSQPRKVLSWRGNLLIPQTIMIRHSFTYVIPIETEYVVEKFSQHFIPSQTLAFCWDHFNSSLVNPQLPKTSSTSSKLGTDFSP